MNPLQIMGEKINVEDGEIQKNEEAFNSQIKIEENSIDKNTNYQSSEENIGDQTKNDLMSIDQKLEQQNLMQQQQKFKQSQDNLQQNQKTEVPDRFDEQNTEEIENLYLILEDIRDGLLNTEKLIINEITPMFEKLNQNNQKYFKQLIHKQFEGFSFILNPLFQDQQKLQQVDDYKILYQKLKIDQNWKALLTQFSNQKFCESNNLPRIWSQNQYQKIFQNHEYILEKILNLNELCSMQNGYHYIEVTELLIMLFDCTLKQEQDGNTICQIIGSTLRVQLYQFQQFKTALRDKNYIVYQRMVQDIQQYQLKQVSKINLSQYSREFQLVIKICISNWNVKSFESFLNDNYQLNLRELSLEQIQCKIQDLVIQNKMIEEIYFSLIFFFYIEYCNIFNFSKEKNELDEQLTKIKSNRERQIKQIERTISKFESKDEILIFLVKTICFFSDIQLKTEGFEKTLNSFQNQQLESQSKLQPYLQMEFNQFLQNQKLLEEASQSIQYLPQITVRQLFIKDEQIDFTFILFNYLKRVDYSEFEQLLKFLSSSKEKTFNNNFEYLQNSYQRTKSKQFTIYILIFMDQLYSFLNSNAHFFIQIFKMENSFKKVTLILHLLQIAEKNEFSLSKEELQNFHMQNQKDWKSIDKVLGPQKIEAAFQFFFKSYLSLQKLTNEQKILMYKTLCELKHFIKNTKDCKIQLLSLSEEKFNFLVLQIQNTTTKIEENIFNQLIDIIHCVLKEQKQQDQEEMIDFLRSNFKLKENFDFNGMERLVKSNIKIEKMYQSQLIYYYQKFNMNDKLKAKAKQLYDQDSKSYQLLFQAENYYNCFQMHPKYFKNLETQKNYPKQSEISLEDFNISLSEMNEKEKQNLIDNWFLNMNNEGCFRKLIPFYFNIIKRKEHPKNFLSFLNKNEKQKQLKLNMKAMFQIFYNNSNDELQSMLLKLWSEVNPIPLIFSNTQIDKIYSLQTLFKLNEKLAFIFPECCPIINLSLGKKQSPFGKTYLLNQVFYRSDTFEVNDNCEFNQNTIDIMFDFCFSGSRNLAIADVHGSIPIDILIQILPLFKIWIIQVDTEDELQENYNEIQSIFKKLFTNQCCFIIRNCKNKQIESELEKQILRRNFSIHKIIDLTQKGLDQQTINTEIEEFSFFIFQKIKNLSKSQLKNSDDFFNLLSRYYSKDHPQIKQIDQGNQLLKELDYELEKLVKYPQGFYSEEAFPIRSLMWQIKNNKKDMSKLDYLNQEQSEEYIENKKNKIQDLEQRISFARPTKILELFQEIFALKNYYILYLKFTEKIRKFNDVHTYKLQEKNQSINEELQIKKQEKKKKQSNINIDQNEIKQMNQDVFYLKNELEVNQREIGLVNIGIELFWRELISIKQKGQNSELQINPAEKIASLVKKGEPFEFLDGDQLEIDQKFLSDFIKQISESDQKVLVLSIIGPQSSGKSTILNKIFGCHFWTSVGRCTKGIYLQLLKITQKSQFDNQFDYVLILDSEGLQNPNQTDPEFDKKIALFILAISDIILINVKGDIHSQFKNLVEMCIFTLGQMKNSISSVKQLSWCFNQNNDCKNFAPFLQQIQSIVNTLNLQINKTEEEGENSYFDYNEVLDLKKENIKILGFAATEQTWRVNANTGIYEEWRQQIINDTFSEEAYIFGVQMIKQHINKITKEQNFQLPSLKQFIQNIESTWQSICRLPDLLEFTELLQYKQDQSMKEKYDQIYQKEPQDYQVQIPRKIQDQVLKEKKKNLEFFKKIEEDEKMCIKQEVEKIKSNVEIELQKYKQEKQILSKICKKYIKILEQSLKTYECNCHLFLFEEITKYEREYQQKKGFTQIEVLVAKISQNAQELKKIKGNRELQEKQFDEIWSSIINEESQQKEQVFKDFADAQYQAIQSSFIQYQYHSTNQEQFHNFIFNLSKNSLRGDLTEEKQQILKQYMNVINSQKQFQIVLIQNSKYYDIFYQPIEERLKKSSKNFILNLNEYFQQQVVVLQIKSEQLNEYLRGNDFYDDFCQFQKKQKKSKDKWIDEMLKTFFSLIEFLEIEYDSDKYFLLKKFINENEKWYKFNQDLQPIFQELQKTIFLTAYSYQIVRTIEFTRNIYSIYPKLKLKLKENIFYGENQEELELQYKNQTGYIQFLQSEKIIPKYSTPGIFQFICDQKQNSNIKNTFNESSTSIFNQYINQKGGWNKIYFEIYDIIKQKMTTEKQSQIRYPNANQQENDSENEEINISDNYLIKQIMSIIEQKILEYNKQFANFGVIFSMIGERCIYYYSVFIIWRFSCYSKWLQLQENHQKLIYMKDEQLKKFIAEIEQNKTEQSILNASTLAKNIKQVFLDRFYQDQLSQVSQSIESMNMPCRKVVQILDDRLLLNYESAKQNNIEDKEILSYILDQKSYIEKYAENQIKIKENEIKLEYQDKLRRELGTFLKQIFNNISNIEAFTRQQSSTLKSEGYFEINDDEINTCDYDSQLFLLISKCISGDKLINENIQKIKNQYKELFEKNYQLIDIPIFIKTQNESEKKIPQLKPFIEELYKLVEQQIQDSFTEPLISKNLKMQESLNKQKLNMIGCLFTCPMCKRKCDQPNDNNHKHTCQNGHQYRGMNGVLINNKWPSLKTCEEIDNDAIITIKETSSRRKWREIKNVYSDWNFRGITYEESEKLNMKMQDIWNSGIGNLICQELSQTLNYKIQFELKTEFNHDKSIIMPIHYILMLDDSGSMSGQRWENAKNGALECMKDISKNGEAKVSVIIFNSTARVVIDCQEVNIENQKDLITFKGGDTSFNQAFLKAFDQITQHNNKRFIRNIILFYTDGRDRYPTEAVKKFCQLSQDDKESIKLVSCAESDLLQSASLVRIGDEFNKVGIKAELKINVKVEDLEKVWTEFVTQSYHNLKC